MMKLEAVSSFVDDQQRALDFSTQRLGFAVAADEPMGESRWLTMVDPDRPDGTQISLEPKGHPAPHRSPRPSSPTVYSSACSGSLTFRQSTTG
jgi:catechol 2,3-dioxygenase-like lactoylglutathione lyase family enzyme